jgi:hypothetical protein
MIRHKCPHCGAKLKAAIELAGRQGRCPTCMGVVDIPDSAPEVDYLTPQRAELGSLALEDSGDAPLPTAVADDTPETAGLDFKPPELLGRYNHYLICNSKEVIATWENDEKGWMVRVKDGFVRASTNPAQMPSMGTYVFIEIAIEVDGPIKKLTGVHAYSIPNAIALSRLGKSDHAILGSLEGHATLSDRQKALVRQRINAKFLPSIWEGTEGIM